MAVPDRIERIEVLPVSRERVWDAITKPEHLSRWLSTHVEMDFRVGGHIIFSWGDVRSPFPGTIEAIEPPHRFAFRWFSYLIGHPEFQHQTAPSTFVEFTLEEVAEGTQLKLVESSFASLVETFHQQYSREYEGGWRASLERLRTYLQNQPKTHLGQMD